MAWMFRSITVIFFVIGRIHSHPDIYHVRPKDGSRVIQPYSCHDPTTLEEGVCMFSWNCQRFNGTHLTYCMDRFYFGSCCKLPPGIHIATPPHELSNEVTPHKDSKTKPTVSYGQNRPHQGNNSLLSSKFKDSTRVPESRDSPPTVDPLRPSRRPTTEFPPGLITWRPTANKNSTDIKNQTTQPNRFFSAKPVFEETSRTTGSPAVTKPSTQKSSVSTTKRRRTRPTKPNGNYIPTKRRTRPTRPYPLQNSTSSDRIRPKPTRPITQKPTEDASRVSITMSDDNQSTPSTSWRQKPTPQSTTEKPSTVFQPSTKLSPLTTVSLLGTWYNILNQTTTPFSLKKRPTPAVLKRTTHKPSTTVRTTLATRQRSTTISLPTTTTERPTIPTTRRRPTTTDQPTTLRQRPTTTERPTVSTTRRRPTTTERPTVPTTRRRPTTTERPTVPTTRRRPTTTERPTVSTTRRRPTTTERPTVPTTRRRPTTTERPTVPTTRRRPTTTERPTTIRNRSTVTVTSSKPSTPKMTTSVSTEVPTIEEIIEIITFPPFPGFNRKPTRTTTRPTTTTTTTPKITTEKAETSTETLSTEQPTTTEKNIPDQDYLKVCGKPRPGPVGRVVGGGNSYFGEWPWVVSLRQWKKNAFLHKCGATLLNEFWAITAAHCVENVPLTDILLRLGEYDISHENEPLPFVERRVQIVASHPKFDRRTFEYDLALLRFFEPVPFQRNIIPACIPQGNDTYVGKHATVTGWGRLYEEGPLPDVIQEVSLPIITNKLCENMYRQAGFVEDIPDIFICAGYVNGGKDSCEGDSGGPMVLQEDDGRWVLAGVISWGIGCALPNQPGVYTRITKFTEWINQIIIF